jgi:hypothetical protein
VVLALRVGIASAEARLAAAVIASSQCHSLRLEWRVEEFVEVVEGLAAGRSRKSGLTPPGAFEGKYAFRLGVERCDAHVGVYLYAADATACPGEFPVVIQGRWSE